MGFEILKFNLEFQIVDLMPLIGDTARQMLLQYSLPMLKENIQQQLEWAMNSSETVDSNLGMAAITVRSSFEQITRLVKEIGKIGEILNLDQMVLLEYEKKIAKSILNQVLSTACAIVARVKQETKINTFVVRLLAQLLSSLDHLHSELWGEPELVLFRRIDFASDFNNCFKELILEVATLLQNSTTAMLMQGQQAESRMTTSNEDNVASKRCLNSSAVMPGLEVISGEVLLYDAQAILAMIAQLQLKHPWNQYRICLFLGFC